MLKRILLIPLLLVVIFAVVFITNRETHVEEEDYFKSDTVSVTGIVSHIEGEQDLYLNINSKVKADDMLWVVATPEESKGRFITPFDNSGLFRALSREEGFGGIEYGEEFESLFLHNSRSFSPDEDAYSWARERGYDPERQVIEKYKDKGWHITLIEITSDPLGKLMENFDEEIEEDITKVNLASEIVDIISEAITENDFEKFRSAMDHLVVIFPDTEEISEEVFMEELAGVSKEEVEREMEGLEMELEEVISEIIYSKAARDPQGHIDGIIEEVREKTGEDVTEENLSEKIVEYQLQVLENDDYEGFMLTFEWMMKLIPASDHGHYMPIQEGLMEKVLDEEMLFERAREELKEHDESIKDENVFLIQQHVDDWLAMGGQDYGFVPSIKLSFSSDNPVYPVEVLNSFSGIESAELSLYVLSDTPVEKPEGWSVDSKREVEASWLFSRKSTVPVSAEFPRGDAFLLMIDRVVQLEDIDGDLIFDFDERASDEYLKKPSIEHDPPGYSKEDKLGFSGIINSAGGDDEVDVWLEWVEEDLWEGEDFENKSEKQTYNIKEKEGIVGMNIRTQEGNVVVSSTLEDSPAYREGIREGERILEVDGRSVEGMSSEDVTNMIRGEKGTEVSLTVLSDKERQVTITREKNKEGLMLSVSLEIDKPDPGNYLCRLAIRNSAGTSYSAVDMF